MAVTKARRLEPHTRVVVFIDGQNLYKSCKEHYGYAFCHPILLARHLAGNRRLVGVRYYSGVPDPRIDPVGNGRVDRRHKLIGRTGVTVVPRPLRYRWEWGFDPKSLRDDPRKHQGSTRQIDVSPYQRAREKGIDVSLALDVVDLATNHKRMDVAIIVSQDEDLTETARIVHQMTASGNRVSVEGAVVGRGKPPIVLKHYDFTHQIDEVAFDTAKDGFDYRSNLDKVMVDIFLQVVKQNAAPGCV